MPVGNVLVCDTGRHVEHDDTALAVDVVAITKTTELLLTSRVPYVELNTSEVLLRLVSLSGDRGSDFSYGGEAKRVDFYTQSRNILLLELSGDVALDEGGLQKLLSQHSFSIAMIQLLCLWAPPSLIASSAKTNIQDFTFPVPPSPTSTSLKVGTSPCWGAAAWAMVALCCVVAG